MRRPHYQTALLGLGLIFSCAALLAFPQEISACVQRSAQLYAGTVFPALFPFFILTSLTVELGFSQWLGCLLSPVMSRVFHLGGSCSGVLVLGLMGGYPAGANAAVTLYKSGQCTKGEAQCLLAFCNNCGPAFFLSIVGGTLFQSIRAGAFLYLIHVLCALMIGFVVCRYCIPYPPAATTSSTSFQVVCFPRALIHAVTSSFDSLLNICAFFLFFSIALQVLTLSGLTTLLATLLSWAVPVPARQLHALLSGLLEVTTGITSIADAAPLLRLIFTSFLLGWGGWSVHFQTLSLLAETDLSVKTYFLGKLLHAVACATLTAAILMPSLRFSLIPVLLIIPVFLYWRKKAVENRSKVYYNGSN